MLRLGILCYTLGAVQFTIALLSTLFIRRSTKENNMAAQAKFAVGDIVKLKSGGPEMTVKTEPDSPSQYYDCQWFAGKKLESGRFPANSLESVKAEKP